MPREAGYAIQLSDKTLLDVRPSTEHKKVDYWIVCDKKSHWMDPWKFFLLIDACSRGHMKK